MEILHRVRLGAWCWVAASPLFIAGNVVVGFGWRQPPYSWSADNISDLGNVTCGQWDTSRPRYVCSPWHALMNVVMVATAVFLAAGIVLAWQVLVARVLLLAAPVGLALAGVFPADAHENLHVLGAALLLGVANLGLLVAALRSRDTTLGRLRPFTLLMALVAATGTGLFFARQGLGIGVGGMERVAVFPLFAWTLVVGAYLLRERQPNYAVAA